MKLCQVLALAALGNTPALAQTVFNGVDLINTPAAGPGAVSVMVPAIPAGFFGPGSDPFPGALVPLMGFPLLGTPALGPGGGYGLSGQADTMVRRLTDAPLVCGGPPVTVPIEIVALHLVSIQPITVTFGGPSVRYDLHVSISRTGPQIGGGMSLRQDHFDGGTFMSTLPVRGRLEFNRETPGAPGLPTATIDPHNVQLQTPATAPGNWTFTGLGLPVATSPGGGLVDHDAQASTPMIPYVPTSNFIVAMKSSSPSCVAGGSPLKTMSAEEEALAKHGILPANRPPVQHLCFGDGSSGNCPCGNNSPPGLGTGCQHSQSASIGGRGALLFMNGNGSVGEDGAGGLESIVLRAIDMKQPVTCIFLQGNLPVPPTIFGDGLRCIGGNFLLRLGTKGGIHAKASYGALLGDQAVTLRSAALGDVIAPGQQRGYQVYFRDPDVVFCPNPPGNTWNVTQVALITYGP